MTQFKIMVFQWGSKKMQEYYVGILLEDLIGVCIHINAPKLIYNYDRHINHWKQNISN